MSSFLLAREARPLWPITAAAVGAFLGVMLKCAVALLGGDGVVASGGLWALAALCATGALHYERQVSNALRRELRSRGHG